LSKMTDEISPWLQGFASSKRWLDGIQSAETKEIYSNRFFNYCKAIGKNPDELLKMKPTMVEIVQMMLQKKDIGAINENEAEATLDNYLYNANLTEHIKISILAATKSFYKANDRELKSSVGKKLSLPAPEPRTPKMQDILDMEQAMTSQRDRAVLWFVESAPFRQGTVTKLVRRDLKSTDELLKAIRAESKGQISRTSQEDEDLAKKIPYYLVIESARLKGAGKGKYRGVKQIGFVHAYAAEKLEKYTQEMKQRGIEVTDNSSLFVAFGNNRFNKGKGDKLQSLTQIFYDASMMAWNDIEKKKFSAQDFRDVLQGALENANVHQNVAAPLMGHKIAGIDKHYSSHDLEEFLLAFSHALPWLVPQTIEGLKAETQTKLAEDEKRIVTMEYDNHELKARVNKLTTTQETMHKQMLSAFGVETDEEWDKVRKVVSSIIQERKDKGEQENKEQREEWKAENERHN
jgi:hypothetical protein